MTEITSLSLFELIKNIKEKKISSQDITKSFIDRSEKSKELNAYVIENFENTKKTFWSQIEPLTFRNFAIENSDNRTLHCGE